MNFGEGVHLHADACPSRLSGNSGFRIVHFDDGFLHEPNEVNVHAGSHNCVDSPHKLGTETETAEWLRQVLEGRNQTLKSRERAMGAKDIRSKYSICAGQS